MLDLLTFQNLYDSETCGQAPMPILVVILPTPSKDGCNMSVEVLKITIVGSGPALAANDLTDLAPYTCSNVNITTPYLIIDSAAHAGTVYAHV